MGMEVYGGATSKAAIEKPSVKTFVSQSPLEKPLGGRFVVWSDLNGPKRALHSSHVRERIHLEIANGERTNGSYRDAQWPWYAVLTPLIGTVHTW